MTHKNNNKKTETRPPNWRAPHIYLRFEIYEEGAGCTYKSAKMPFDDALNAINEQRLKLIGDV